MIAINKITHAHIRSGVVIQVQLVYIYSIVI